MTERKKMQSRDSRERKLYEEDSVTIKTNPNLQISMKLKLNKILHSPSLQTILNIARLTQIIKSNIKSKTPSYLRLSKNPNTTKLILSTGLQISPSQ